jgi:SSS family solute:Na+ symporter
VIAIIAMIVVSIATKKTTEKILDETQTGWYISK